VPALLSDVDAPPHEDLEHDIRLYPPKVVKLLVFRIERKFIDNQTDFVEFYLFGTLLSKDFFELRYEECHPFCKLNWQCTINLLVDFECAKSEAIPRLEPVPTLQPRFPDVERVF
jgi:hypothetical protein